MADLGPITVLTLSRGRWFEFPRAYHIFHTDREKSPNSLARDQPVIRWTTTEDGIISDATAT